MHDASIGEGVRLKFAALEPVMDERVRRQWAASEARSLAWGGISLVALATGMSRSTIRAGIEELEEREATGGRAPPARIRRVGGGGKPLAQTDPAIVQALEELVAPETRGDPMSPLRWTLKSTSRLAAELTGRDHPVSARTVAALLKDADYSLQGNRKTREGAGVKDHRRRPRLQFEPVPALESSAAGTGRRDGPGAERVPLPAGDQQVEQDRTPPVLSRHAELAREAAGQPRPDRQTHRRHDDRHRLEGQGGAGHRPLRERHPGERRGTERGSNQA